MTEIISIHNRQYDIKPYNDQEGIDYQRLLNLLRKRLVKDVVFVECGHTAGVVSLILQNNEVINEHLYIHLPKSSIGKEIYEQGCRQHLITPNRSTSVKIDKEHVVFAHVDTSNLDDFFSIDLSQANEIYITTSFYLLIKNYKFFIDYYSRCRSLGYELDVNASKYSLFVFRKI